MANLPLSIYEIKYDSVKGRRHLGPLGDDLAKVIPESIELRPRSTYPSPNKVKEKNHVLETETETDSLTSHKNS